MNKNDKFHGAEFEVNAQAVTDEKLEGVDGGFTTNSDGNIRCPNCGNWIPYLDDSHRFAECLGSPLFDPMLNS